MPAKVAITVTDGEDGFTINLESFGEAATEKEIITANMLIELLRSSLHNLGGMTTDYQVKESLQG